MVSCKMLEILNSQSTLDSLEEFLLDLLLVIVGNWLNEYIRNRKAQQATTDSENIIE